MKWKIKETAHFLNAVSKLHTYNNVLSKHDSDGNWTFAVKRQSWSPIMCPRDSWENQKSDTRFICASLTPYIGLCNNHFLLPALFLLGNPSRMKSNHKSDGTKQQRADIILAGSKMKKKKNSSISSSQKNFLRLFLWVEASVCRDKAHGSITFFPNTA